jgi:hypothetical protein
VYPEWSAETMGHPEDDADELVVGAEAIAREVFGGKVKTRQVYRLFETDKDWPVFKMLDKYACRRGPMREEIARREQHPVAERPPRRRIGK